MTSNGLHVYGMPSHVNSYFKIGIDAGGDSVLPGTRNYIPDGVREKYCMEFCKEFLPKVSVLKGGWYYVIGWYDVFILLMFIWGQGEALQF